MDKIKNKMSYSIRNLAHDTLDSLQQHPILKGVLPTIGGVGMTFVEQIEPWLRILGVIVGIIIGLLTVYSKIIQIKAQHAELKSK